MLSASCWFLASLKMEVTCLFTFNGLHRVKPCKIEFFVTTGVLASNPIWSYLPRMTEGNHKNLWGYSLSWSPYECSSEASSVLPRFRQVPRCCVNVTACTCYWEFNSEERSPGRSQLLAPVVSAVSGSGPAGNSRLRIQRWRRLWDAEEE